MAKYTTGDINDILSRAKMLRDRLLNLSEIRSVQNNGKTDSVGHEIVDHWGDIKDKVFDAERLQGNIEVGLNRKNDPDFNNADEKYRQRILGGLEQSEKKLQNITKSLVGLETKANTFLSEYKPPSQQPAKKLEPVEEDAIKKTSTEKPVQKSIVIKEPTSLSGRSGNFNDILKEISDAVSKFNKSIPGTQRAIYDSINEQVQRLDLNNGQIKPTVNNLKIVQSIKNKLSRLIVSPEYIKDVKQFAAAFNTITTLQNEYWASIESTFKPRALLKQIRIQTITDTVKQLTESGIGANISDKLANLLRTNITTGGSYKALNAQLREQLLNTQSDGLLLKYTKQITNDSINQYNAQYTHIVSSDLGYEWFAYQGSDITTTRPFCDAMTDFRYFHITEVPRLLRADDLTYVDKSGKRVPVPIYDKTGLPGGMIPGTNAENFFVNRGGYNCGHQIRPVPERNVPQDIQERVKATQGYKIWKSVN